jgi:hypothetical protein
MKKKKGNKFKRAAQKVAKKKYLQLFFFRAIFDDLKKRLHDLKERYKYDSAGKRMHVITTYVT